MWKHALNSLKSQTVSSTPHPPAMPWRRPLEHPFESRDVPAQRSFPLMRGLIVCFFFHLGTIAPWMHCKPGSEASSLESLPARLEQGRPAGTTDRLLQKQSETLNPKP